MELKSLVVIDCLRPESVSKLAWCNASLYGTNGKIIRMVRFCSCSSSASAAAKLEIVRFVIQASNLSRQEI